MRWEWTKQERQQTRQMEKKLEGKQNLTEKRRNISWGKEMEMRGERIKKWMHNASTHIKIMWSEIISNFPSSFWKEILKRKKQRCVQDEEGEEKKKETRKSAKVKEIREKRERKTEKN